MIPLSTTKAQESLDDIHRHIAEKRHDPATAARVTATIVTVTHRTLHEHPKRGRPGRVKDTREPVVAHLPNPIVAYTLIEECPVIPRVVYGAQNWPDSI